MVYVFEFLNQVRGHNMLVAGFAFSAATILLMNIWDLKQRNLISLDIALYMEDVRKCQKVLKDAEDRYE